MSYHSGDTIVAISTALGGAARGIVRISGPDAVAILSRCFLYEGGAELQPLRRATIVAGRLRVLLRHDAAFMNPSPSPSYEGEEKIVAPRDEGSESTVPCDVFVWPTNRSYTREPVAELHTLGSPPILEAVLSAVCRAGARLAAPGEFTLRAFLSGRLDLTQAEAVLGVIDAHGERELEAALAQLSGGLAGPLRRVRDELLQLLAELEAGLDFVDDDIEFVTSEHLRVRLSVASRLLDHVAAQMATRHTAGQSAQIALVGAPNAGKSSLFNALAAKYGAAGGATAPSSAALVSPHRGTTRDYLIATIFLDGLRCELVDTAGVDKAFAEAESPLPLKRTHPDTEVEVAAQAISLERGARALIRALCIDSMHIASEIVSQVRAGDAAGACPCDVIVFTKSDLAAHPIRTAGDRSAGMVVVTSSVTGAGLEELGAAFRQLLTRDEPADRTQAVGSTADRCRESVRLARDAVARAVNLVLTAGGEELVAIELRAAIEELGKVVGAVYTDDLLDRIFKTFCIGK